jgi:hypothetical protein
MRIYNRGEAFGLALALAAGVASAGPPFRTDDPEPVELHHWEVYAFSAGADTEDDVNAVAPGLEVNYGAAPNLQLHLVVPLVADKPAGGGTAYGVGDLELGVKYRFIQEDEHGWRPQVGVFPIVELPTGAADRGLGAGYTRAFLPIWIQKSSGDWPTYGGGGYWINPGPGNQNYWFAGWLLQRQVSKPLAIGAEVFYQSADKVGGKASPGFNVGGIYDFSDHYHLLFSVGRAFANARQTNQLSYYVALQTTF